jgi:SurA N-terminal domain
MFDFVQEKKYIVYIVLGLITASFALVGVNSYQKSGSNDTVATVNGTKISAQEARAVAPTLRSWVRRFNV